jgi:hypothetical protein
VYTFGHVMVGDSVFADAFQPAFGDRYFRHVYRKNIVPHLPPSTMGSFVDFGNEQNGSWVMRGTPANRLDYLRTSKASAPGSELL